jgi:Tfp pilus assembly protein PilV
MKPTMPHHMRPLRIALGTRAGFTVLEVVFSTAMLAVLVSLIGQTVVLMNRQTQLAEHHALALQTVENLMEELTALSWDQINDDTVAKLTMPASVRARWPKVALSGSITATLEPLEAKQISLRLSLSPDSPTRSAALTTWIYRDPAN